MSKKNLILLMSISMTIIVILGACKKNTTMESKTETVIPQTEESTVLDKAYIIPDPQDILLLKKPASVERLNDNAANLKKFMDSTGLDPEMELKKYLQRKREYDKSSIFSGVP